MLANTQNHNRFKESVENTGDCVSELLQLLTPVLTLGLQSQLCEMLIILS